MRQNYLSVAQPGQSSGLISRAPLVQIQPSAPTFCRLSSGVESARLWTGRALVRDQQAVPYFTAHLGFLELQNYNAAQYYLKLFDEYISRYSKYTLPGNAIDAYGGRW